MGGYWGDTIVPAKLGYNLGLEFAEGGVYREYKDGLPLASSHYEVGSDSSFHTRDRTVPILRFESSEIFALFGEADEQAVQLLRPDTLVLIGTGSDSRFHLFIRRAVQQGSNRP